VEAQLNVNTDIALMWLELQDFDLVRYILIDEPIVILTKKTGKKWISFSFSIPNEWAETSEWFFE